MRSSRVLLIGPRGAGKSTVGPPLARLLSVPFVDTDAELERQTGRTVAELMREGVFRVLEADEARRALASGRAVVAVGGGAVLWDGLEDACAGWRVVWLDAAPAVLAGRIRGDGPARPSLTGPAPADEIAEVRAAREPLYAALAWRRIATDEAAPDEIARRIHRLLKDEPQAQSESAD